MLPIAPITLKRGINGAEGILVLGLGGREFAILRMTLIVRVCHTLR
jgi:hypothetical protein